ncbi:hypothetical protein SCHPADRAFT_711115 [Schizopora paradoxa]|uniref:Uncharacterized protein n=1 Tax=Schizopora paradoxa TaxID=27342 RepID=A0A0H2R8H2_9AGAM|nr:hypothetical protein SCHPADRAFT_711115 [Schizopora paradoxa]
MKACPHQSLNFDPVVSATCLRFELVCLTVVPPAIYSPLPRTFCCRTDGDYGAPPVLDGGGFAHLPIMYFFYVFWCLLSVQASNRSVLKTKDRWFCAILPYLDSLHRGVCVLINSRLCDTT